MIYNNFKDKKLSALGLGCMRLPLVENSSNIDMTAASEMIDFAMKNGINYYDTAWGYHEGQSETAMGKILKSYPRDSFYLASKFPGYELGNMDKVSEIFEQQLKKCQVDYFDFYLFHNVCELNINEYLDPKFGIYDYLIEQKKNGRIKHLGFSAHGNLDTMKRFLDAYGKDMEFCQLQINWLDWEFQKAKEKVELVKRYNIPVWVMEPVRGGKLIKLEEKYENLLKALKPNYTNAEWAFRFLQSIPEVVVTLSGMSNMEQLGENIATYENAVPLTDTEMEIILNIARDMTSKGHIPCTACRYCTSYCPQQIDIPWMIELYNEHTYSGGGFLAPYAMQATPMENRPSACIGCKACEAVCPQNIKISEVMNDFSEKLK